MGNDHEFTADDDPPTDPAMPPLRKPAPTTPIDERVKVGLAAGSFLAMAVALIAGKDLAAAAFGSLVTTIVGSYFSRRNP